MATETEQHSEHLAAARELLVQVGGTDDPQAKATAAAAHATLVLAEQVAAARVMLIGAAVARRKNGKQTEQETATQPQG